MIKQFGYGHFPPEALVNSRIADLGQVGKLEHDLRPRFLVFGQKDAGETTLSQRTNQLVPVFKNATYFRCRQFTNHPCFPLCQWGNAFTAMMVMLSWPPLSLRRSIN